MADLRISESIVPLSDFKAHAADWMRRLRQAGGPVVITQSGRAAAVLLSPEEYDALTERARFVDAVRQGLADTDAGRLFDHDAIVAEMKTRYGCDDE
jgi:prevent-host-death family protein